MNRQWQWRVAVILLVVVAFFLLSVPDRAWAGPGGEIVEGIFKSKWGRIIVGVLAVILLPVVVYVYLRQAFGIRRTRADLADLASRFPYFDWAAIENRVRTAALRLYRIWGTGDISSAAEFCTVGFLESQQDILDRWAEEGRHNVTELKKLRKVRPLFVSAETEEQHSVLQVLLTVDIVDYLEDKRTKKIVKGKKRVNASHDIIWTLIYDHEANWLLHSIGDGADSLTVASLANRVDTSYLERTAAVKAGAQVPAHSEEREQPSEKASEVREREE